MAEYVPAMSGARLDTHRWPRARVDDLSYGVVCSCGNLKTDQALTCFDCAAERRRADDYWQQRTCACGGPKTRGKLMCRPCRNATMRGVPQPRVARSQPQSHPFRKAEALRLAR